MKTKVQGRLGMLYPLLVIAAVLAITFSVLGVATLTGILPAAPASTTANK